ncbi:MAG: UDP-2,3-diacylglucosamine diphosphatase [Bdellovibrionales bacterium]
MSYRIYFVSDIHIKGSDDSRALLFLNFLKNFDPQGTHLFLLGDIFDVWIGTHQVYIDKYNRILDEIRKLVKRGVQIHYFEGNHDFHIRSYWKRELGVQVYDRPKYFEFDGLNLRVEHGDESNPDDLAYLRLRKFLRSIPMTLLAKNLRGSIVQTIGETWSGLSRKGGTYVNEKVKLRARQYAIEKVSERSFDLIIFGHIHMRDEFVFEFNGKQHKYVNLGTWLDKPCTYLVTPGEHKFIELT